LAGEIECGILIVQCFEDVLMGLSVPLEGSAGLSVIVSKCSRSDVLDAAELGIKDLFVHAEATLDL
jgi:hypothetical protein